jgi:hypothetical protein
VCLIFGVVLYVLSTEEELEEREWHGHFSSLIKSDSSDGVLNGAKRTWSDLAHIQPTKCKIRVIAFLLPNMERSHSILKN